VFALEVTPAAAWSLKEVRCAYIGAWSLFMLTCALFVIALI
jgi:hypothetical protein